MKAAGGISCDKGKLVRLNPVFSRLYLFLHCRQIEFEDVGGEEIHRNFDAVQVRPGRAAFSYQGLLFSPFCRKQNTTNHEVTNRDDLGASVDLPISAISTSPSTLSTHAAPTRKGVPGAVNLATGTYLSASLLHAIGGGRRGVVFWVLALII